MCINAKIIKRVLDLIFAIPLCMVISPLILVLAIGIKLDSKGPVFFNTLRIGKNGKTFNCYKFRSMYINSDEILKIYLSENPQAQKEWKEFQKLREIDPRVTRIGKIIRRTSLDELPQLLNVLKGEMSLVGPRPYLLREIELMGEYYSIITQVVPGITGFWQVNGRSEVSFLGRLKMDDYYIRNWSIWMDIILLIKTVKVVFFGRGAV